MASRAVTGEDLRRRLALVEIGLGVRHDRTQARNEADHGSKTPRHPHLLNLFPRSLRLPYRKTAAM
jgi:hypothetical protein